jgi:tetratricopeptide (TPR) repeat protein
MMAEIEDTAEAKADDCRRSIEACRESLKIFSAKDHPREYAELQTLLWAAFTALGEVEDKPGNCRKAIDACSEALQIYAQGSQADYADALKNLACTYIALAQREETGENCRKAIEIYETALNYHSLDAEPLEHADILKDIAYSYVALSEAEDREECSKKALKAYKKACKIYAEMEKKLEDEGDPMAAEIREKSEECNISLQSCKKLLKAAKRSAKASCALR